MTLLLTVACATALFAAPAFAQTPAPKAPVTAGWSDGFVLQSADGDNRLVFGFVAQADGRFVLDDADERVTNTFTVRKFRPTLTGRVARYFDFKLMPDFGSGTAVVADAYMDIRFSPAFRIRTGKDKTPIGLEVLQGDAFLLFPERALASSLVPNRDIGVQVQGDLMSGRLFYAAGVFNGIPDGTSSSADVDANDGKDLAGRVVVRPFRANARPDGALAGLGFALGGSAGEQRGPLPSFRTSTGRIYFSYAAGAVADGTRRRITPSVFYYQKSFGAFAEYVRSTQYVARSDRRSPITNDAWEVTGSYVLTGEPSSDRGVRPRHPFDPAEGHWGALEVIARYTELHVDDEAFSAGFAGLDASGDARSFAVGVNWYPASVVKYYATYEHTVFGGSTEINRPAEDAVIFRAQLGF
jgi:phosphate-selective porin OprO/OprP